MPWFREHIKLGSRLALMALVLQFALSFGHFHAFAEKAAPATRTSPTKVAPASSEDVLISDAAAETSRKQQPSNDDRDYPAGACAICAVISLAGSALFAAPPVLLLPQPVDLQYLATHAGFLYVQLARSAFQSRAPPSS
ncbi:hypothetical protein XI09_08265 [Bradyrhizobium sp. CCBAU 11386]|uniref:DUF2946 family protein n=1 Tax=Bradyrhizobium sp. CCBAU 11386 TaxID=1630837 RepID=UPI002302A034|nr:DUF2946 family protein [Bradyrhizobium sp. CCBAU 11386]MDA9504725.1 hypothetical protein [Bradyrhizobium sp. CCBAU 11386]